MLTPDTIKFSGFSLTSHDRDVAGLAGIRTPVGSDWARVHFDVPSTRDYADQVETWLRENCNGNYVCYKYHNTRSYSELKMVVRFEDHKDAVLFKLHDAHRIWEQAKL
ncbi:hypothetical protein D3C71_1543890 [compost metagenome]